jgi:archaellum component FlaG (FlaF/FlaG flagellin family)
MIGYDRTGLGLYLSTNNALPIVFYTSNTQRGRINSAGEWIIDASGTDAGDYKLQVVGNARIGTGKLDISSNTAFSMNVQRSGTSEVAGTFNNSNGILYLGAESSTGGSLFTGSSSYAAVIGSGAAYPLQFATNNVTRATINTNGELLINTLTDNGDFKLQVNGNALISGSIKTANGSSSTAQPWHLGSVVATNVQLDTANYVEVEINGTFYRLAIVTPL